MQRIAATSDSAEAWTPVRHACRFCGGRIIRSAARLLFMCSTCEVTATAPHAICGCGITIQAGPRRGEHPFLCVRLGAYGGPHVLARVAILHVGEAQLLLPRGQEQPALPPHIARRHPLPREAEPADPVAEDGGDGLIADPRQRDLVLPMPVALPAPRPKPAKRTAKAAPRKRKPKPRLPSTPVAVGRGKPTRNPRPIHAKSRRAANAPLGKKPKSAHLKGRRNH